MCCVEFAVSLLLGGVPANHALTEDPVVERHQILAPDGQVIGYGERRLVTLENGGRKVRTVKRMSLREAGTKQRKLREDTQREYSPTGALLNLQRRYSVGAHHSTITAELNPDTAHITREVRGDRRTQTVALPADIRFDNGAGLLRTWDSAIPLELEFQILDVESPAVRRVALSEAPTKNPGIRTIERRVYSTSSSGGQLLNVTRLNFDTARRVSIMRQPTFGGQFQIEPLSSDGQLPRLRTQSLMKHMLVKSPVRIPARARSGHIRFSFASTEPERIPVPVTGEQRVRHNSGGLVLDVCADCGSGLPTSKEYLNNALQPGFWLQSDHPTLLRATRSAVRDAHSTSRTMSRLTALATRRIRTENFTGHFSALEAWRRRTGDCTEAAVLLAALGRAAGIPTRVASGLVYSRERYHGVSHTFLPHAWVIAYVDGRWRSFDSALDGFDSTHIAFTVSDGDPQSISAGHRLAGLLSFRKISEIRNRPRPAEGAPQLSDPEPASTESS